MNIRTLCLLLAFGSLVGCGGAPVFNGKNPADVGSSTASVDTSSTPASVASSTPASVASSTPASVASSMGSSTASSTPASTASSVANSTTSSVIVVASSSKATSSISSIAVSSVVSSKAVSSVASSKPASSVASSKPASSAASSLASSSLSSTHNAGKNCNSCHKAGGTGAAFGIFTVSGTAYKSNGTAQGKGIIRLYAHNTNSVVISLNTDLSGNFYTTLPVTGLSKPGVDAEAEGPTGGLQPMGPTVTSGACNGCHNLSTGKIISD